MGILVSKVLISVTRICSCYIGLLELDSLIYWVYYSIVTCLIVVHFRWLFRGTHQFWAIVAKGVGGQEVRTGGWVGGVSKTVQRSSTVKHGHQSSPCIVSQEVFFTVATLGALHTCATLLGESSPNSLWHKWASGVKFLAQGNNSNRMGILGIEPGTLRLPGQCTNLRAAPLDTSGDKDTIPGWCHPLGVLHRHHHVNPTFILTQCKSCPGKTKCGDWMHSVMIVIEYSYVQAGQEKMLEFMVPTLLRQSQM